jgi:RNA polymerase sigma factor (sigma-70 family)
VTREDYGRAYEQYGERTVRFLLSRGVPRESAQDYAQTAWMRGWERLYQLRDQKFLSTWINTIALNCYRRAMFRDRLFQNLKESIGAEASIAESPISDASIDLSRIMKSCRPEDRTLLEAQLAGVTAEEIAIADGVSQVAIRVRFSRARRAARLGLQRTGLGAHRMSGPLPAGRDAASTSTRAA